jgi:hypothetical protein
LYLCSPFVEAALVKGNFKTIVMLPKYVDIMEWVAVNGVSLVLHTFTSFSPFAFDRDSYMSSLRLLPEP